uniref:Uncharacterized protein n=1 Tax=Timema douglasi TaxID=61478 RepID=A0A7R8VDE5_TIMDO|nr:unnamed protein product [Timema douglasi]
MIQHNLMALTSSPNTNMLTNIPNKLGCTVNMPQQLVRVFRPPEDCEMCRGLRQIDKVANITQESFHQRKDIMNLLFNPQIDKDVSFLLSGLLLKGEVEGSLREEQSAQSLTLAPTPSDLIIGGVAAQPLPHPFPPNSLGAGRCHNFINWLYLRPRFQVRSHWLDRNARTAGGPLPTPPPTSISTYPSHISLRPEACELGVEERDVISTSGCIPEGQDLDLDDYTTLCDSL